VWTLNEGVAARSIIVRPKLSWRRERLNEGHPVDGLLCHGSRVIAPLPHVIMVRDCDAIR
jgi:hypothetical protein